MHTYATELTSDKTFMDKADKAGVRVVKVPSFEDAEVMVDGDIRFIIAEAFGNFQEGTITVYVPESVSESADTLMPTVTRAALKLQEAGWLEHTIIHVPAVLPDYSEYPKAVA
jgi:hypothetical protein